MRPILSSFVLLALAVNPCFAKGGRAQHGARASSSASDASGKGTSGANPAPNKGSAPIDAEAAVAPPVLAPRGSTQHQIRIINPSAKIPTNAPHSQVGAMTTMAPTPRNAIGQPVATPKNFVGPQPGVSPALRASGVASPPIVHGFRGVPSAPAVVSSGTASLNVANVINRGSVNGATVIRPANAPSIIGGPAQPRYGINGTTVQNRH